MKHMHLSKLLALALALACVLPLVIGCGGETGGKEEETTTAAVTTEAVTEPPEADTPSISHREKRVSSLRISFATRGS